MCSRETPKFPEIFMVEGWWFLKRANRPWDECSWFWRCFFWGYALKRTSKENEKVYQLKLHTHWWKTAYTLMVNSENDSIKLIKNLRSVCNEGGFNLTKFISNSKKVLHCIPVTFRRNGVKDKDHGSKLPDEQAFGVLWNVGADIPGFTITIKEKLLPRRGMLPTLSSIYNPLGLGAPLERKGEEIIQSLCAQNFKWVTKHLKI